MQTISASVAAGMQSQINVKNKDFEGSEHTIKFILLFDQLFDIFNTKRKLNRRFKRQISLETIEEYTKFLYTAEKFIKVLTII